MSTWKAGTPYLLRHRLGKEAALWLPAEVKSLPQGHAQGQEGGLGDKQNLEEGTKNEGTPRHRMEGGVQMHTSLQQEGAQTETAVVEQQTVKAYGAGFLWELKGTVTCRDLGLKERGSEHLKSPRNYQCSVFLHEYAWWPASVLLGERHYVLTYQLPGTLRQDSKWAKNGKSRSSLITPQEQSK